MASTEPNVYASSSPANPRLKIGSRDKSVGWYQPTLDNITEAQRDLLEKYSHLAPDDVIPHILEIVRISPSLIVFPSTPPDVSTARSCLGSLPISLRGPAPLRRPLPLPRALLPRRPVPPAERRFPPRSRLLLRARPAQTRARRRASHEPVWGRAET